MHLELDCSVRIERSYSHDSWTQRCYADSQIVDNHGRKSGIVKVELVVALSVDGYEA